MRKYDVCYIKKFGSKYKLTRCKSSMIKGYEDGEKRENTRGINTEKLDNNLYRAKENVYQYAMCNEWEYFCTLTLDPKKYDRYNLQQFIKDLGQYIRNLRRGGIDIKYVLMPEQHKDGAWHLHGLLSGIPEIELRKFQEGDVSINGKPIPPYLYENEYFEFPRYTEKFGYNSLGEIKNKEAVAKYVTKYVVKDVGGGIEFNKRSYYNSKGLKKAVTLFVGYLENIDELDYDYKGEYAMIKWLTPLQAELFMKNGVDLIRAAP